MTSRLHAFATSWHVPFNTSVSLLCTPCAFPQVGDWSWNNSFGYIAFIYNVCYAMALFWMLLFYVGTEELLHVSGCRVQDVLVKQHL